MGIFVALSDESVQKSGLLNDKILCPQVDAFTAERFRGNPAAVCILDEVSHANVDDSTKSKIAAEMNLSETAFVEPSPSGEKG